MASWQFVPKTCDKLAQATTYSIFRLEIQNRKFLR